MKKIALFLFYLLLFFAALLFFAPKENIYYFAEEQLKPFSVIIGSEEAVDHGFILELLHAKLYVQKIKSADIDSASIGIYGLYNILSLNKIVLDKTFEQFFPLLIEHADLHHSLFSPFTISGEAVGDFGEAEATVDLLEHNATVILRPSKLMLSRYRSTLKELKKSKEGDYRYDYQF